LDAQTYFREHHDLDFFGLFCSTEHSRMTLMLQALLQSGWIIGPLKKANSTVQASRRVSELCFHLGLSSQLSPASLELSSLGCVDLDVHEAGVQLSAIHAYLIMSNGSPDIHKTLCSLHFYLHLLRLEATQPSSAPADI